MELNSNPAVKYRVREQSPKEIEDRRKILYPVMYRFKMANLNNRVYLVRDKLYLNGHLYNPEADSGINPPAPQPTKYYPPPITFTPPNRQQTYRQGNYTQGTIPTRYSDAVKPQQLQHSPIPTSNMYHCLTNENINAERLPGQNQTKQYRLYVTKLPQRKQKDY